MTPNWTITADMPQFIDYGPHVGATIALLTPDELAALPDGTLVVDIHGGEARKGTDPIDDDTRGGYLAWGLIVESGGCAMTPTPGKYVGLCYDSGAWSGDLTGILLVWAGDGWAQAGSHISSSEGWASIDIRSHFDRREEPSPGDTFEWVGLLTLDEAMARFAPSTVTPGAAR